MTSLPLEQALNPEQRAAVVRTEGPLLILAGAGTGKTRVVTWRIAHLLASGLAQPQEILAVTFTNKAARELRERVAELVGPSAAGTHVSTFHSACARWLRRWGRPIGLGPSFSILDTDDQLTLLRTVAEELHLPADATAAKSYAARVDEAHQLALRPREVHERAIGQQAESFAELYERYEEALTRIQACDFGSLIARTVHLLEDHPQVAEAFRRRYRYVMVDEFQDTDPAQYRLLLQLAPRGSNVAVVGDDDQAIYGWRGATVENVRRFRDDHDSPVVALVRNYRSTRTILEAAHDVVSRLPDRMEKKLRTDRSDDRPVVAHVATDDREEAEWVVRRIRALRGETSAAWHDFAVFYRTNAQSRVLEERMRSAGVPYELTGGVSFYDRREVRDALAWLRIIANPRDDVAFRRIVHTPPRGVGKTTLAQLDAARRAGHVGSLFDALQARDEHLRRTTARTRSGLDALARTLDALIRLARTAPVNEVLEHALTESGYETWLGEQKDEDTEDRVRNLGDLRTSAREFAREQPEGDVSAFLESISLRATTEAEIPEGAVQMMTVHASKGLEFENVFVTGLEDRQFPNLRRGATMEDADLEEERRLYYVAVTRARSLLHVTAAMRRRLFGQTKPCDPSPFLLEMRGELVQISPESASRELDWRRGSSERTGRAPGAGAGWGRRGTEAPHDPWDQRSEWEEPAWDSLPPVPEEGVVFDDSHYPQSSVDQARAMVGRRALHRTFGTGVVRDADPVGPRVRLTIEFPGVGTKKVVASYVELLDD